jgi:flagellar basal-body rod protein FlgC
MFDALDMGASGLKAQRIRLDTIAENIANINTTRNARGEKIPYKRRFVILSAGAGAGSSKPGVHVDAIKSDEQRPFQKRFQPGHPDADAEGYVLYPNIDPTIEFVNALEASRSYEANVNMMDVTKAMINASLRLLA